MNNKTQKKETKQQAAKVTKVIAFAAVLLCAAYLVFYFMFNLIAPNSTVKYLGFRAYNIMTESMLPSLEKGDLVVVVKHDFLELKENDIVTFVDPLGNVVTHIFAKYETYTRTNDEGQRITRIVIRTKPKSDSEGNLTEKLDAWRIPEENYIGKYSFKVAKLGAIMIFFQSWLGILSLTMFVSAVFVAQVLIKKVKDANKEKESLDK